MSLRLAGLRMMLPVGKEIGGLSHGERQRLFERAPAHDSALAGDVAQIISAVRSTGDAALREFGLRFDGVALDEFEVPRLRWQQALAALSTSQRDALERAADGIMAFHRAQLPQPLEIETRAGVKLGRRTEPLRSVGVYAPGGRARYPSSVLMGVVPARVAGVRAVIVASPPGPGGLPAPALLAACAVAGADRVFAVGGAGAIAALALGTTRVPRVDKIVGPGNAYVTEAKRQLYGQVAVDAPAGPSELLILADESADPRLIALELLAQSEHDPAAASVLVCTSTRVIAAVARILEQELARAPRQAIMEAALERQGALLRALDESEMLEFAEQYAPEHLLLLTREPRLLLEQVRCAGSVFLGAASSVAFGDYTTGANHVLPTGGRARAYSGLGVSDFLRTFTYQEVADSAAAMLAEPTAILAELEGLPAHAQAARARRRSTTRNTTGPVLRTAYRSVELYDPQRSPCEIDLSDNTNLFGPPPAAQRILAALPAHAITRYPSALGNELKIALADWFGVAPENVVTGCGSDDLIDAALRAFCEPRDRVVLPAPTFGMVSTFTRMNAAQPVAVPLRPDLTLDVEGLVRATGRVTYVCSPNNPTGNSFAREDLNRLAQSVAGVLLLDEAYADFADADFTRAATQSQRLFSLRTFSKAFGLAGLRIGFGIGAAPLVHEVEKSRGPYKVNHLAELVAVATLREDADWIRAGIAQVRQNRERLRTALARRGLHCWPTQSNFVLLAVPDGWTAVSLASSLRRRGVAVRSFPDLPLLGDCLRITVGPWSLMERFLARLAAL